MKSKYITLASTLLMLSGCVLPAEYGVSRTRAGSAENLATNNELNALAEEYWGRYLCKKGESSFLKLGDQLYQIAGAKPIGILLDKTPADELNGIDASGVLMVSLVALRDYSAGQWSDWSSNDLLGSVHVSKRNGTWEIEGNPRLQSIDCNSIPG